MNFQEYLKVIQSLSANRGDVKKAFEINSDYNKILIDLIQDVYEHVVKSETTTGAMEDLLKNKPIFNKFKNKLSPRELQRLLFVIQATVKFFVNFVEWDLVQSMSKELEEYKKQLNTLFGKYQEVLRNSVRLKTMGDETRH